MERPRHESRLVESWNNAAAAGVVTGDYGDIYVVVHGEQSGYVYDGNYMAC